MTDNKAPCGAATVPNHDAGYGSICLDCLMVVGSVGMPKRCAEILKRREDYDANIR